MKKYGTKYHTQTKKSKKLLSKNIKRKEHQEKIKEGMIKSLGVDNPSKCKNVIEKKINTFNEKKIKRITEYGLEHNFTVNSMEDDLFKCNCKLCDKNFEIRYQLLHLRKDRNEVICTNCNILYGFSSKGEEEIYDFIREYYDGEIILRDRKLGIELDLYLPEFNLAIEHNGVYWHNELNKPKDYH